MYHYPFFEDLYVAAQNGNLEAVKSIVEKDLSDEASITKDVLRIALTYAAVFGRFDVVEYLLEKSPIHLDLVLLFESTETLQRFLRKEPIPSNRPQIIKAIIWKDKRNINLNFLLSREHDPNVARFLINNGANDLDGALVNAAYYGVVDMVQFLIQNGAKDLNKALLRANHETIEILIKNGANNLNEALIQHADQYIGTVEALVKHGANAFEETIKRANDFGNTRVVRFLQEQMKTKV